MLKTGVPFEIAARFAARLRLTNDELAAIGIGRDDVPRVTVLGVGG